MRRKHVWVGLDVGVETMACCVVDEDGEIQLERQLPTSAPALRVSLRPYRRRVSLIALEAGTVTIPLARALLRLGLPVSVFETRQVSKYLKIKQNKTDRNDARGLAEIARTGQSVVAKVFLKDAATQQLRSSLVMRQSLLRMRIVGEGAIRSLISLNGGHMKSADSAKSLRHNVVNEINRLRRVEKIDLSQEIEPVLKVCESLRLCLEHSERTLATLAKQIPVCQRFMQIPGVGPMCALSFYTAIGDPKRFARNSDVGAYLGMTPRLRQSGKTAVRSRISKMGNCMTRSHLVTAAGVHLRCADTAIRDWGIALRERAGAGRARVAVARKLATAMLAIWKSGSAYEPYFSSELPLDRGTTGSETGTTTRTATILNGLLAEPVDNIA